MPNTNTITVPAISLQVGDYLDATCKTRVAVRHPRTDKVLVQTRTRGTRSPFIRAWGLGDQVRVWRRA